MYKDITNQKFGKLIAINPLGLDKYKKKLWLCKCDCGNEIIVQGTYLRNGNTISCGCIRKELNKTRAIRHGYYNERLYRIWYDMKRRCYNKNRKSYKYYGGKGIEVYNEWLNDFMNFYNWSKANGYADNLTLERIDFNKNYCPENCKWIPQSEQTQNSRHNHFITFNNRTMTITQWSKEIGISPKTIRERLNRGWRLENVLSTKKFTHSDTSNL